MEPSRSRPSETKSSYEITVQTLARQTSAEDSRILLTALDTLAESAAPLPEQTPRSWRDIVQLIHEMPPELQGEKTRLISIARHALERNLGDPQQAPSAELAERPQLDEQGRTPGGLFDTMSQPLFPDFLSKLSPKSRALLAQTGRTMRDAVRAYAAFQATVFNNDPDLKDLLGRFNLGPIDAKNFDFRMNELFTNVMPPVFQSFRDSTVISDGEKEALLKLSFEAVVSDSHLLRHVLQAFYDNKLVEIIVTKQNLGIPGETLSSIQAAPKLEDKAAIAYAAYRVARFERESHMPEGTLDLRSIDAENFDAKMNGVLANAMLRIIRSFIEEASTLISDDEKAALLKLSPEAVANDPHLFHQILQIFYDGMLVSTFREEAGVNRQEFTPEGERIISEVLSAIQAAPKLEDKAKIIRERLPDVAEGIESKIKREVENHVSVFFSELRGIRSSSGLQRRRWLVDAFLHNLRPDDSGPRPF
jgi:hypothetical protein